jgi:hypothetical protein
MFGVQSGLLSAMAVIWALGCSSNPTPQTPSSPNAKDKLQQCCEQAASQHRRNDALLTAAVVRTPEDQARLDQTIASWRAAHETCEAQLGSFQGDLNASLAAVQAAAGSLQLAADAPACKP